MMERHYHLLQSDSFLKTFLFLFIVACNKDYFTGTSIPVRADLGRDLIHQEVVHTASPTTQQRASSLVMPVHIQCTCIVYEVVVGCILNIHTTLVTGT